MDYQLELEDVVKNYGSFNAVNEINLQVEKGEIVSLLGASGCGKTTTLRMIAGLVIPTSGTVKIEGQDITRVPPYKRDVAMVFQDYALFPHMTVYENIIYGLKNRKIRNKAVLQERAHEILDVVQLEGVEERYPRQLSGGQQQRVSLARALIVKPRVMLFDEPLSNLDAKLKLQTRTEIRRLLKEMSITAVYVTHDQEEALHISDRVAVMNEGKIEQISTPKALYRYPKTAYVADFIGHANLFDVTVQDIQDDVIEYVTANGTRIAGGGNEGESCSIGDKRTLMIRPECIRISNKRASDENCFAGKAGERSFLGSVVRYKIQIKGDVTIQVDVASEVDDFIHDNQELYISFDRHHLVTLN